MARRKRISSQSGYIHIITRGVNKQDIFLEKRDYRRFLDIMEKVLSRYHIDVVAFCLMSNHVHLLLYDNKAENHDEVSAFMHDLLCLYAIYFNKRYERSGHLFQNRYTSRIIETKKYLMLCIRYIHNNPVKAGISGRYDYQWSSYREYIEHARADMTADIISNSEHASSSVLADIKKPTSGTICNTSILDQLFGSIDTFIDFHKQYNLPSEVALEYYENHKAPSDIQAKDIICSFIKSTDPSSIQSLPRKDRNAIIDKLTAIGNHASQIARITGLSKTVITHRKQQRA